MIDTREALFCMGLLISTAATAGEVTPQEGNNPDKPPTRVAASTLSMTDAEFVKEASTAGESEIAAARLALKQTRTPAVQRFAQRMIREHSAAGHKLDTVAALKTTAIASAAASNDNGNLASLQGLHDAAFDKAYLRMQVDAHEQAVKLFQAEAQAGQDLDVKQFAARTLPMVQHHLQSARQLAGQLG
jgi:putative membrane protein